MVLTAHFPVVVVTIWPCGKDFQLTRRVLAQIVIITYNNRIQLQRPIKKEENNPKSSLLTNIGCATLLGINCNFGQRLIEDTRGRCGS